MNNLWQEIRYGARMLAKKSGSTFVAVITIALGIGASTAIFSVVNGVLLRPLPYKDSNRFVMIWGNFLKLDMQELPAKPAEYLDYRDQTHSFDEIAAFANTSFTLTNNDVPERIAGARVTANLFRLLGADAALGRSIAPEENSTGRDSVAMISHSFWQRRFGGDPQIIDKTIRLDDRSYTIIGVMPDGFQFPHPSFNFAEPAEVWVPLAFDSEQVRERRGPYSLNVIASLKHGVSLEQAESEMSTLAQTFEQQYRGYRGPGGEDGGWRITIASLKEQITGHSRRALLILFAAVGLMLLIACANVANLLMVRATSRQKELAIRSAIGASRLRLVRQMLIESLLIASLGGAFGLLLAMWGVDWLAALSSDILPRVREVDIDGRVFVFTAGLVLLTGLIFGIVPAISASKPDLQRVLKQGSATGLRAGTRLRSLSVVAEIAVAVVLLAGAGLMINSLLRLQRVDKGVDADKLLTVEINLPRTKYRDPHQASAFYQEFLGRVESLAGVESASLSTIRPLNGTAINDPFSIEGRPIDMRNAPIAGHQHIAPNYFRTLGIPIVEGRDFTERDNMDAPAVAIINEAMARRYWSGESALGKRITLGAPRPNARWATIVGIVKDIPHRTVESSAEPDWYLSSLGEPRLDMYLFVRATKNPASLASAVRDQVLAIDKAQPVTEIKTMNEVIASTVAPRRFNTFLLSMFAVLALALASVGIYGVVSYSVSERTHEIGIRMAMGATTNNVMKLVIGHGTRLALTGIFFGIAGAYAITRLMESLLFGVSPTDPLTFAGVSVLLLIVALLACYIPARRATKVDPMVALRYE